jgi:chromosome segregation ATPase
MSGFGGGKPGWVYQREAERRDRELSSSLKETLSLAKDNSKLEKKIKTLSLELEIKENRIKELEEELSSYKRYYE